MHVYHLLFYSLSHQRLSVSQQSQGESISSPLQSQPSQGESSPCSDISSYEEATSPLSAASSGPVVSQGGVSGNDPEELPLLSQHFLPCDPTKWNVQEVFEFIRSLPGMWLFIIYIDIYRYI